MDAGFRQALQSACTTLKGCVKQLYHYAEKRRLENLALQQMAMEQQQQINQMSYELSLTQRQVGDACAYGSILITPEQAAEIACHFIRQTIYNRDFATASALQAEMLPMGLDHSCDFLRSLHQRLFTDFLHIIDSSLTYTSVSMEEVPFFITRGAYAFTYSIKFKNQQEYLQMKQQFKAFENSQACRELYRAYGIKQARITFNDKYHLVILLK